MPKKVIVITGGSEGLGKALAIKLSKKNHVVILSPDETRLLAVANKLKCSYRVCDISNLEQVKKSVLSIIREYKKIDVLINNAGIWMGDSLEMSDPQQIKRLVEINFLGTIWFTQSVVQKMKRQKDGLIINIISQGGLYGKAKRSVYYGSKWGVAGFTRCLQEELEDSGIRITGLYPGKMKTNILKNAGIENIEVEGMDPKEVAKLVEFIISFNPKIIFPEVGIAPLNN
jgi:short-subunit dehydrogenase